MGGKNRGHELRVETVEVKIFENYFDFYQKIQSLEPAWLKDFLRSGGAKRAFIWGLGARQRPHINGSD